jgi:hypothetical protein
VGKFVIEGKDAALLWGALIDPSTSAEKFRELLSGALRNGFEPLALVTWVRGDFVTAAGEVVEGWNELPVAVQDKIIDEATNDYRALCGLEIVSEYDWQIVADAVADVGQGAS